MTRNCTYSEVNCKYAIFFVALNLNVSNTVLSDSHLLAGTDAS